MHSRRSPVTSHQSPVTAPRAAFTLIELMVVIIIIGILAAVLLPAISGAIRNARETEVVAEIKNFDAAIASFKNRYGIEPPSFIVLYEQGAGVGDPDWNTDATSGVTDAHRRTSRALVRQLWPDFDFTYGGTSIDINGNGATDDVIVLNGAECLVFFLGGVFPAPDPDGDGVNNIPWGPVGFSANPQYPFLAGGNRVGPFFEFRSERLIDIDVVRSTGRDGKMPEYLDPLNGQTLPYQYVSSYDGRGYQQYGLSTAGNSDDELMQGGFGLQRIYYSSPPFTAAQWISNTAPELDLNGDMMAETTARPFNPGTYQIISPGGDQEFGVGGYYDGDNVPAEMVGGINVRAAERDNITNFKGGRLN